jgi:hypothetical protein
MWGARPQDPCNNHFHVNTQVFGILPQLRCDYPWPWRELTRLQNSHWQVDIQTWGARPQEMCNNHFHVNT